MFHIIYEYEPDEHTLHSNDEGDTMHYHTQALAEAAAKELAELYPGVTIHVVTPISQWVAPVGAVKQIKET